MYSIVLVEDERTVREGILKKIDWEAHGFELAGAYENGRQAADALEKNPVNVVITDVNMPVMDGLELARFISETAPQTMVVILTGFGDFSYAQTAIRYRVKEYILKPVTAKQLSELLDKLCKELNERRARELGAEALRDGVRQALPIMREQFLSKLITDEFDGEKAYTQALELNLRIRGEKYVAAILQVYPPGGEEKLLGAVCEAISQEPAEAFGDGAGNIILLASGENPGTAAREIAQKIIDGNPSALSAVIGGTVGEMSRLKDSYLAARTAWEQLYRMKAGTVLLADEQPPPETGFDSGEFRRAVLRGIKLLDLQAALREFDSLVKNISARPLPRDECKLHLQKLAMMLGEYAEEEKFEPLPPEFSTGEASRRLAEMPTLWSAQGFLRGYIRALVEAGLGRGDAAGRQAALAVDYIKENYRDQELSLQKITAYLSMSTSHFSNVFKNYTGVTFIDFLTRLRMNKAQELLVTTDMKNYEIADRVGYDDPGYFSSTFKKFTGIKPSDYRRKYKQDGGRKLEDS